MAEPPKQPRNAEVVSKEGQFNQAHARWWDSIARRAYSAIQSFTEFFSLDTIGEAVDTTNDYLLIYNASDTAAQKVSASTFLALAQQEQTWTLIEEVTGDGTSSALACSEDISGYDMVRITWWVKPDTDGNLYFQVATSGPTWLTGTEYAFRLEWLQFDYSAGTTGNQNEAGTAASGFILNELTLPVGADATEGGHSGCIILTKPGSTTDYKLMNVLGINYGSNASDIVSSERGGGIVKTTSALTQVRLQWVGGTSDFTATSGMLVEGRTFA